MTSKVVQSGNCAVVVLYAEMKLCCAIASCPKQWFLSQSNPWEKAGPGHLTTLTKNEKKPKSSHCRCSGHTCSQPSLPTLWKRSGRRTQFERQTGRSMFLSSMREKVMNLYFGLSEEQMQGKRQRQKCALQSPINWRVGLLGGVGLGLARRPSQGQWQEGLALSLRQTGCLP